MYDMLNELAKKKGREKRERKRGERHKERNKLPITSMRLIRANNLQFGAGRHSIGYAVVSDA
jgi:hypothetical protein